MAEKENSSTEPEVVLDSMNQPVTKSAGKGETKESR